MPVEAPTWPRSSNATADLFEAIATGRPLCWLIEDLHWADASSSDVFAYVVRSSGAARVLTVATSRPTGDTELFRAPTVDVVELSRLGLGETREQLQHLGMDHPPAILERIAVLSDGVPFHVEELAATWDGTSIDTRFLRRLAGGRTAGLSTPGRELAEAAALAEGHLHPAYLDQLGFDSNVQREVVAAGLLEADPSGEQLRFCHALLREAIEQSLLPADRERWHRRWAEALEDTAAPMSVAARTTALAHHWAAANNPACALRYAAESARIASRAAAPAEEVWHLRRVLDLWDRVDEPERLAGWTRDEVTAYAIGTARGGGHDPECQAIVSTELARCEARGDEVGATALRVLNRLFSDPSATPIPDVERRDARALLEAPVDARVLDALMYMSFFRRMPHGMEEAFNTRALELGEALESPRLRSRAYAVTALVTGRTGRFEDLVRQLREAEPTLGDMPMRDRWIHHASIVGALRHLGRAREARDDARRELGRLNRPEVLPIQYQSLSGDLVAAMVELGEWDGAEALIAEVWRKTPPTPSVPGLVRWPQLYLQVDEQCLNAARGRPVDPDVVAVAVAALGAGWKRLHPEGGLASQLAELATAEGDLGRVRELLEGAWELEHPEQYCDGLPSTVLAALRAETLLVDARDEAARRESAGYAERVMAAARRVPREGPLGEAWWSEAEAHAGRARGRDTPQQWAAAAAAWRACEHPWNVARCRHQEGVVRLAAGDRDGAAAALRDGLGIADALGAAPLADQIAALARRARLDVGARPGASAAPARSFGLTPREGEVLALLAEGLSNEQIATTLFMSPKTASVHVSRILMKLGAANRTQAAVAARQHGLV